MLECRGLAVAYGRHQALKGVDIRVAPGEIVVILGANGAGKTTLLKAIAGLVPMSASGQVMLDGHAITRQPPHRIVEAGLALVPEGRGIFGDLTVKENLMLGAFAHRARADQQTNYDRLLNLFPKLAERSNQRARTMSGGEQQMVAIGRALMAAPLILMLDEPSLGLSPLLCGELFKALATVRKTGVGILLVEQNARQSLAIADRAYLLENGEIVGAGPADQLARDPAVQAAYLGGAAARTPVATSGPARVGAGAGVGKATAASASAPVAAVATRAPLPDRAAAMPGDTQLTSRIADLVRNATRVQAAHVVRERERHGSPVVPPVASTVRSTGVLPAQDLDQALARIVEAARQARQKTLPAALAPATPAHDPAAAAAAPLPEIEVYRRPKLEIYRRTKSGSLEKDN